MTGTAAAPPALEAHGLTKRFGSATVLDAVDLALRPGEVHALLGENGAGKSTLMNILSGIYAADGGRISVAGETITIHGPSDALALGIGMVHQHFRLAGPFTGRENIRLAAGALADLRGRGKVAARLEEVLARTGFDTPLDRPVDRLSVADRQRIEILKALTLGARILVLDEPTAVLTDQEADRLLALVRRLAESGTAVVLITHKLREVMAASDRVSVMRRGRMVLSGLPVSDVGVESLSEAMIGQAGPAPAVRRQREAGSPLMTLDAAAVASDAGATLAPVDLTVRAGQIVGIAGVGGNGQQDLAELIVGLRPIVSGRMTIAGADRTTAHVAARREAGLRYIPADRGTAALAPNLSLNENIAAASVRAGALGQVSLSPGRIRAFASHLIAAYGIQGATAGGSRPVRLLSGGNAQKAVLARELDAGAQLVVAHSPTRGLDVAACRYVQDQLVAVADRGAAVVLISEDLEEILSLSDAIHVMSRGRLSTTPGAVPSRAQIGELMLGHA